MDSGLGLHPLGGGAHRSTSTNWASKGLSLTIFRLTKFLYCNETDLARPWLVWICILVLFGFFFFPFSFYTEAEYNKLFLVAMSFLNIFARRLSFTLCRVLRRWHRLQCKNCAGWETWNPSRGRLLQAVGLYRSVTCRLRGCMLPPVPAWVFWLWSL